MSAAIDIFNFDSRHRRRVLSLTSCEASGCMESCVWHTGCLYQCKAKEVGMRSRNNQKLAIAAVGAHYLASIAIFGKAFHYVRAARRDERAGFSSAAAFEWRKTAELLSG